MIDYITSFAWYWYAALILMWAMGTVFAFGLNHKSINKDYGGEGEAFWTFALWPLVVAFWLLRLVVPSVFRFLWPILRWCLRWCGNPFRWLYVAGVKIADYVDKKESPPA